MISYEDGIFVIGGENQNGRVFDLFYLNLGKSLLPFEKNKTWIVSLHKEKKFRAHLNQTKQLYKSSLYSDVIFKVQDQKIFAHKVFLGTRCKFFSDMFSSNFCVWDSPILIISP